MKTLWRLDTNLHLDWGSPFLSNFVPDFAIGLHADVIDKSSPFHRRFLNRLPELLEPSITPFPNSGHPLCFPFLVWERKTDAQSSLFKAQNQLALPIIKSLDILSGLSLTDMPILDSLRWAINGNFMLIISKMTLHSVTR